MQMSLRESMMFWDEKNLLAKKIFLSLYLTQAEKVKAYFQRGARQILGFEEYPNQVVGYGALCVEESLP